MLEKTAVSECLRVPLALGSVGRRRMGEVKKRMNWGLSTTLENKHPLLHRCLLSLVSVRGGSSRPGSVVVR